jgi:hypothetical protein
MRCGPPVRAALPALAKVNAQSATSPEQTIAEILGRLLKKDRRGVCNLFINLLPVLFRLLRVNG